MKYSTFPIILSIIVLSCGKKEAAKPTDASAENGEIISIKTARVETKSMSLPINASGIITSSAEQRLSFKVPGVIAKMMVDEGNLVRAGQLLATLDLTEINAQVNQATRSVEKAERDLARVENLRRDSAATLELLQNATTARDVARETQKIAVFNQKFAEIRATTSGKVIKKMMNEGEVVGPGIPVFVIFAEGQNDWVAKVSLPDRDWARLNLGQLATIKIDAYPDINFTGKVSELAPAADPTNGLYSIEIRINPNGKRFAPGLFAQVEINPPSNRNYQLIPIESIIEGNGKDAFVFTVENDGVSVKKQPIRVAFLDGKMAVVASGLEHATEVVSTGSPYLTEKSKVRKL